MFLFPRRPSYIVPTNLFQGIKAVNPMFRGYSQQVSPSPGTRLPVCDVIHTFLHATFRKPSAGETRSKFSVFGFLSWFSSKDFFNSGFRLGTFFVVCFFVLFCFLQRRKYRGTACCNEHQWLVTSLYLFKGSIFIHRTLHFLIVLWSLKRHFSHKPMQNFCIHFFPLSMAAGCCHTYMYVQGLA